MARGTVSILDAGGVVFSRIWCAYEVYVSLAVLKSNGFKWDVYTSVEEEGVMAVGITDGLAACDGNHSVGKAEREANFPSQLARDMLSVRLEHGQASVPDDQKHILNSITGEPLDAEPLEAHHR